MQQEHWLRFWATYVGPPLILCLVVPALLAARAPWPAAALCIVAGFVVIRYWCYRHLLWLPMLCAAAAELIWAAVVLVRSAAA
jgi:hypothetical protein